MYVKCNNQKESSGKARLISTKQTTREISIDINQEVEKLKIFLETQVDEKGAVFRANQRFYEYLNSEKMKQVAAGLNQLNLLPAEESDNKQQHPMSNEYKKPNFPSTNTTYYVANENANLGYALASADLNFDGLDDLVIGAPVYSEVNKYQNGAVFVILANASTGSVPLKNINLERDADIVIKPPADAIRSRFGHSIAILDINIDGYNDIVISAPSYDLTNINYQVSLTIL